MENKNLYALLIGVGDYEKLNISNLASYRMDLTLIGAGIMTGLKCPRENIRILAGIENNGTVLVTDLAKAIIGFRDSLTSEDTFIFYFSGHGSKDRVLLSDGQLELQSIVDFIDNLPAKNKLVILDCCNAGGFIGKDIRELHCTDSFESFAERGIAVIASSSKDELSRLGETNDHSMFTGVLSSVLLNNKKIRKGRVDISDIFEDTKAIVNIWNSKNPGKEQTPIYRSSVGGTLFFPVEEYNPYEPKSFSADTQKFVIDRVEPLNSLNEKRMAVFAILKDKYNDSEIADITKKIVKMVKNLGVYSSEESERLLKRSPIKAIWVYFGYDKSDLTNSLHAMYSIWAASDAQDKYYKDIKDSQIIDGIYIWKNTSYEMLKKMQEPTVSKDEYIIQNKEFLSLFVNMASQFIKDLQAVANKEKSLNTLREEYTDWINNVRQRYIKLSELDIAPDDLHDWSEEIFNLAGCILDVSILLECEAVGEREQWLIGNAIRRYNESISKLYSIEKQLL